MRKSGGVLTAIAIAGLLVAMAVAPSGAATKPVSGAAPEPAPGAAPKHVYARTRAFDGLWSVSILTQNGFCAPSYRYPARILNGRVLQADNDFSYQIGGTVTGNGGIVVTVSSGGQGATGYGRLSQLKGAGWWRTDGGQCSGTWSATRRS